jgi:predicted transposase/invertase (TIGR01784 family)
MKTDKIFYTLFQVFPELLFQLIGEDPELAQHYEFKSIEIKELSFRLDGVYLPYENYPDDPLYFVEVQFQKDEGFYWRFITEIMLYLNQYKPSRLCYPVVLWANDNLDPGLPLPYQQLLADHSIQRIYLNQIDPETSNSLGFGIIKFIIDSKAKATQQLPLLINQAKREINDPISQKEVIELIEKIIVYKFPKKSREELEAMFNLTDWRQTKFYQETKLEGKLEGKIEGKIEGKLEGKIEGKLEAKLEMIPILMRLGLNAEQIAQELELDLKIVRQHISSQNN